METRFMKKQMSAAYQYSWVRLVLNYYTLFESIAEKTEVSEEVMGCCQRLNSLMEAQLSKKDIQSGLLELRGDITRRVETLTSYTDCFQIYAYVLNRLERKFETMPETGLDEEDLVLRLMEFIEAAGEAPARNERIRNIIEQLPVRLTKQKFFSFIMEGLSVYLGASKKSLEGMMYVLRTESMVSLGPDMEEYQSLYKTLEKLRGADYRTMTAENYEEVSSLYKLACENLTEEAGMYMMLQELVNDMCVLALSRQEALVDEKEEAFYQSLVSEILEKFLKEDYSPGDEAFFDKLTRLEGKQEAYYERYLRTELPEENEERKLDPDFINAVNVDRLLSGSSFAELKQPEENAKQESAEEEKEVDRPWLEQVAGEYFKELETVFSGTSKPVVRAIMAKVLSDLPVYFRSMSEIEDYIRGSLESCLDEEEKETCKELLEELMDYENILV